METGSRVSAAKHAFDAGCAGRMAGVIEESTPEGAALTASKAWHTVMLYGK